MNRIERSIGCIAVGAVGLFAPTLQAETLKLSNVNHQVVIDRGKVTVLPSGDKVAVGVRTHASVIWPNGEERSQWCTGSAFTSAAGEPKGGAGYCESFGDDGDVFWVSYMAHPGRATTWTIMGGTGRFEGATGSGTTTAVSQRGDGAAWSVKVEGTLTTK